ncbi:MAG TPA: NUDIX domain-containing protein [Methylobacter sp.]|jgi:8-oxo-dGTP pyrophosphatase MutT (NUDIX family)
MIETVALILFKPSIRKILLQHRSDDAPTFPDHYSPFGGAIEFDESPEDAILREAFEELTLDIFDLKKCGLKFIDYYDNVSNTILKKRTHLFVGETEMNEPELLRRLREGKGLAYFSFWEATRVKVAREDRALLHLAKMHFRIQ